jgi:hypothetical protein
VNLTSGDVLQRIATASCTLTRLDQPELSESNFTNDKLTRTKQLGRLSRQLFQDVIWYLSTCLSTFDVYV